MRYKGERIGIGKPGITDLDIDRTITKRLLKKWGARNDFIGRELDPVSGFCEHRN
jgi:hypothetical protein